MIAGSTRQGAPQKVPHAPATTNESVPPALRGQHPGKTAPGDGAAQLRFAQSFAQVVSVLMRDPGYRSLAIADLEWLVLPAMAAGQFRLAHATMPAEGEATQQRGVLLPAAVALWARVSPLVDRALSENVDKGVRLSPAAWTSGDILWLIAAGGHPRAVPAFLKQLREHEFKGRPVKMRQRLPDGTRIIVDLHQAQKAA